MKDRTGTVWARAVSLLSIALAILLAPLLVVQSANADTPASEILKHGTDTSCSTAGTQSGLTYQDGSCVTFVGYQNAKDSRYDKQWAAFDLTGPALPAGANIMMCYLGGSPDYQIYCTYIPLVTSATADSYSYGPLGANGHQYWANWAHIPTDTSGGTICMSINNPHLCGFDQSQGNGKGDPNSKEIGYAASAGTYEEGQPGQKDDGSIDPIACIQQSLDKATDPSAFDPIGYIFTPVKCAFLWATTMPTNGVRDLVNAQTQRWNKTQLGATVNSVDFFSAFQGDSSCSGLTIPLSGFRTPGSKPIDDMTLLRSCQGADLSQLAGIVRLGLTLTILIGGALKIARMISAFIKGPQLDTDEHGSVTLF